jgi:UDP-N-acetylglucosamine--N-acetylmuramyl-(pentapeptide) pyrophosphoryl-undecaprenol N-acetylglucosamine transferase
VSTLKTGNSCAEAAREHRVQAKPERGRAQHAHALPVSAQAHVAKRREAHDSARPQPKQATHARRPRVNARHLIIMAAGTGGHVIPGLAVAKEMQQRGWTISWLGTTQGIENRLVPPTGIPLDAIVFSGLRGKGLLHMLTGGLRLLAAFWSCLRIIRRRHASAVLGMGGYVCFPGGLMASLLNKPLMLVNADASLLMSNKALLPLADRIAFGFDGDAASNGKRAVVTGNPVRAEIEALAPPPQRFANRSGALRLLVVGGSLGAKALNDCVPQALALLSGEHRPLVTHQTGAANHSVVQAAYEQAQVQAEVLPFIDDMARRLADCDVIVCRAGAVTVSELCAAGVAAVLVPLVVSTTSHQRDNAQWLAGQGAGIHLPQAELSPRTLADLLMSLTREALLQMAVKARALAKPKAAAHVADELERLVVAA